MTFPGSVRFLKTKTLERFYSTMNTNDKSYEFPPIYSVSEENYMLVTIEKRIAGSNMKSGDE